MTKSSDVINQTEMDQWTLIAKKKLAALIRQDDFLTILAINNHSALLEFSNSGCRIDGLGKVTWINKDS